MYDKLWKLGFQEKSFHTGDVILNYVAGPSSNGPPLVFIHGQTMTWEEYVLIMPLLCGDFQVYAVTVRGHGKSSWTPGQYTINQAGEDLAIFLREVVGQPAIVAGNSSGGILTAWLAANAKGHVKAVVLEDPPLFRCEYPNIKKTWVYDVFLALTRSSCANGGGFAALYRNFLMPNLVNRDPNQEDPVTGSGPPPPQIVLTILGWLIVLHLALWPGQPVDIPFLPLQKRISFRSMSSFDGNFSRAFVEGTVGAGFDCAETLGRIEVPVLFLHAKYFMREGRLMGALSHDDVERARELVQGTWKYVNMDCGHAIALDAPEREAQEIRTWVAEQGIGEAKKY